ncbi:DsbA family protein [Candidatus Binatia bacterium]|nr:DsbA family protein [Candidatus Binatia bacterium]
MSTLRLVVYSDYLCPWCYNAAVRLERLEAELAGRVELTWRTYLLRPEPDPRRSLEKFRRYTQSWLTPASEPDAGAFQTWQGDAGPPSHSIPPHLVAKAAASLGGDAFRRIHRALLEAYFGHSRDITDRDTLRAIWLACGLPEQELDRAAEPHVLEQTLAEHAEAIRLGMNGVPSVHVDGDDAFVTGAYPLDMYRRWVERRLAAAGA